MKKILLFLLVAFATVTLAKGASPEEVITFRFLPGDGMFYVRQSEGMKDNATKLDELFSVIHKYRSEIQAGNIPVHVDGYSASAKSARANRNLSFERANRVKSELILKRGLTESNFVTRNLATAYEGQNDVVVVTLRVPAAAPQSKPEPKPEPKPEAKPETQPETVVEVKPEPMPETAIEQTDKWRYPYKFAIRTNLLYDAMLTPTIGIEWRINRNISLKGGGAEASHTGVMTIADANRKFGFSMENCAGG